MMGPGLNISFNPGYRMVSSPDHRRQLDTGADADPVTLAGWSLELFWSSETADVGVLEMLDMVKMYTAALIMGTNDVSRGESRKVMRFHEKMSCFPQYSPSARSHTT